MSEVRADKLQGIWASAAETTIPPSPTTGTAYRNTAYVVTPGFKFNTKSPSEAANQWMYTVSKIIADLELKGTLGWNAATAYPAGAIAMASDGAIYQCILEALGKDPVSQPTYWTKLDVLNRALTTLSNITTVASAADGSEKVAPDVVDHYWVAADGNSWYRKYKSGWVEQGGRTIQVPYPTLTVTFFVPFTKICNLHITTDNLSVYSNLSMWNMYAYNVTNTTFKINQPNNPYVADGSHAFWSASGF